MPSIQLNKLSIDICYKKIKNAYLRVYPPHGEIKVSAPLNMPLDTIRLFVDSKLPWVKQQQEKIKRQERETPREFIDGEQHYYAGKRYPLNIVETKHKPKVELSNEQLILYTRPDHDVTQREATLNHWYRQQLKQRIPPLIQHYEQIMQVHVAEFGVKRMKTRWGTCNPSAKRIWLSLELAKKSPPCLEYVVVHEMVHLLEPTHNHRFVSFMDLFFPDWQLCKNLLENNNEHITI